MRQDGQADSAEAHNSRGNAFMQADRYADAVASYRAAIALQPALFTAQINLGKALENLGRLDEATASYQRATALRPDIAEAHNCLGNTLRGLGRLLEALASYRKATALQPDHAAAHNNLGNTLHDLHQLDEALASYARAIAIHPNLAETHCNLGNVLRDIGRFGEALASYNKAIALKPDLAQAHNNLGNALRNLGRLEEAEASFRRALAIKPDYATAYNNLGNDLNDLGRVGEAEAAFRRALELKPDFAEAYSNRGNALLNLGRLEEAQACYAEALRRKPDCMDAHSNLIFTLDFDASKSVADHQAERTRWYQAHGARFAAAIAPHANIPDSERPLKVGYVSADFKTQSAAFCFAPVMLGHDPERYRVYAYSDVRVEDALTARLRERATGWRSILGKSDEQVAAMVRADEIDVLVDVSGHRAGHRLLLFARKPAPVQVTAWGQATGTGIPQIDAFLGDAVIAPQNECHLYAETVAHLPCIVFYGRLDYLPEINPLPAIANGYVTFACLNRLAKVSPESRAAWARLLTLVPGAKLMLKDSALDDPAGRRAVIESFAAYGIGEDRLILLGRTAHALHLAAYGEVDIALDPFPHNGGTTSLEALWMGVPVVTWLGGTVGTRTGASINTALGLTEFIAKDIDGYIEIARQTASDLGALARLRAGLRPRIAASPIGDPRIYTKAVETVYRDFWRKWCGKR